MVSILSYNSNFEKVYYFWILNGATKIVHDLIMLLVKKKEDNIFVRKIILLDQYYLEMFIIPHLTLLWPLLIKINTVLANFNNTRPSLILNN